LASWLKELCGVLESPPARRLRCSGQGSGAVAQRRVLGWVGPTDLGLAGRDPLAISNVLRRQLEGADLVERKRTGAEKMKLDQGDLDEHTKLLDRMELTLKEAQSASQLPQEPTSAAALQDFVVRIRLDAACAERA